MNTLKKNTSWLLVLVILTSHCLFGKVMGANSYKAAVETVSNHAESEDQMEEDQTELILEDPEIEHSIECPDGTTLSQSGQSCIQCPTECKDECVAIDHDALDITACVCKDNEAHDADGNCVKCPDICKHGCSVELGHLVCHCTENQTNAEDGSCVNCPKDMCPETGQCYIAHSDGSKTGQFKCICPDNKTADINGHCVGCPSMCASADGCYFDDYLNGMMCQCHAHQTQFADGSCHDCPSQCQHGCDTGNEKQIMCRCSESEYSRSEDGSCEACPKNCKKGCHYDSEIDIARCNCMAGRTNGKDGSCIDCPKSCEHGCTQNIDGNFQCHCLGDQYFDHAQNMCVSCPSRCGNLGCFLGVTGQVACQCEHGKINGKDDICTACPKDCFDDCFFDEVAEVAKCHVLHTDKGGDK